MLFGLIMVLTFTAAPVRGRLLPRDPDLALRLSNSVLLLALFVVGYWWAHYTDARPGRVGLTVMLLGLSMVLVAVALGG